MLPRAENLSDVMKHPQLAIYDKIQTAFLAHTDEEADRLLVLTSVAHAVGVTITLTRIKTKGIQEDCEKMTDSIMTQLEEFAEKMKNKYPQAQPRSMQDMLTDLFGDDVNIIDLN